MIFTVKHLLFFSKLRCDQLSLELYTAFLTSVNKFLIYFLTLNFYKGNFLFAMQPVLSLSAVFDSSTTFIAQSIYFQNFY